MRAKPIKALALLLVSTPGILLPLLIGCVSQSPMVSLEKATEIPSTPTPAKIATTAVSPSRTPPPLPRPSTTPSPSPTPAYALYSDIPFTIVFLRKGNLWVSEIGGEGERQITNEPADWPVWEYDVSPTCDRIAYIAYQGPPTADAVVKQVDISSGAITILAGEGDPYSEINITWLDGNHIAFQLQEVAVADRTIEPTILTNVLQPFNHVVVDLTTGESTFVPESILLSQSPDGHYWLTCAKENPYVEGGCQYTLYDRVNGAQWRVVAGCYWSNFEAWSPDSQFLMFWIQFGDAPLDITTQLRLVDPATRKEWGIIPEDRFSYFGAWAPDSQTIAFKKCPEQSSSEEGCSLWLMDNSGGNLRQVPLDIPDGARRIEQTLADASGIGSIAWTPDGSRLVFTRPGTRPQLHDVWSVRIDGSDLRPIVLNVAANADPAIICQP